MKLEDYRKSAEELLRELATEMKDHDYEKVKQNIKDANYSQLDAIHLGLRFHEFRIANRE